ncbi:copper-translocating P-type ATPase [Planctomycetia bacterium]|jgi:Cd2+/Zn2+-exporting ATPase|nr:copper-translocating P-type ATPase [Planctomycetia bacterium]
MPETPAAAPRGSTLLKWQIGATLVGGTLLLCSVIAQLLWSKELYPAIPAALAMLMLGAPLVYAAIQDLLKGEAGMNALVALAVIGAAATGKYQESAAIAFFMIVSGLIEKRTAIGAEASIESLIKLSPTKAARLREGGGEEMVEAKVLRPGDLVRVRPGDNIPADGRVVTGTSTINQASITGESLPVDKIAGDEVFGGTINLTGVIDVEVTKAGADTLLGRVKDLILQAEKTKTPIMRLVDQYAAWYTPTVLMLVGVVLFFALRSDPDTAFDRAIAMLVIACPSALILATPTAMVAGLSAAARLGVLIKSVVTLEAARNLTAIVFDKTGTLTTGILQVTRLAPQEGVEPGDLLRLAACAEQDSRHPVARAVTEMARKAKLKLTRPTEFEEVAGKGVRSEIDGRKVLVGRGTWLADKGNGLSAAGVAAINEIQASSEADGLSVLYVVRDGELAGWIGLEDNARPEAAEAVDRLRDLGLKRLVILTGDRRSVAKRVAEQMHFSEFKAEVLPHEKLEMVDELKAKGHRVAVIGDGVNDAPALAAGDISIAMGAAGSDVAIHSASIALMNSNLNRVPFLIELSRRTISVIRQNMIIGGLFILVFMSLAGAGYVTPVWAAFLHIVSGLIVIFNSARLVRSGEEIEQAEADRLAEIARRKARTARIAAAAT